jgi:hypothetical protein
VIGRNTALLTASVDDETVMLDADAGEYFGLDPVATRIWDIIATPVTVDHICATLLDEYDVDPQTCRSQVLDFLGQLAEARLVHIGP